MSILKVARIGHPVVRAAARPVDEDALRGAEVQRPTHDVKEFETYAEQRDGDAGD
jgi:hypothetical protein